MASLALRSARPWRAMGMRDRPAGARAAPAACAALCAAAGGRRAAADVDLVGGNRAMLAAPRAGAGVRWRRRATAQQRATNTTLAATRRHPCRPRMVAADCPASLAPRMVVAPGGTERSAENAQRFTSMSLFPRARARGAALAARARGWCATLVPSHHDLPRAQEA